MYSQEKLECAVDIQKYLIEEIQKHSDSTFPKKSSRKTRYFFITNDSFLISNKKHDDEIRRIFEMVNNVSEKSKKDREVINYCIEYNNQKYEDTKENNPRTVKLIEALIYTCIAMIVLAQINNFLPSKGDLLKFISSNSSVFTLFFASVSFVAQIYIDVYYEYDLFPNTATYILILKILHLAQEKIENQLSI